MDSISKHGYSLLLLLSEKARVKLQYALVCIIRLRTSIQDLSALLFIPRRFFRVHWTIIPNGFVEHGSKSKLQRWDHVSSGTFHNSLYPSIFIYHLQGQD